LQVGAEVHQLGDDNFEKEKAVKNIKQYQ